MECVGECRRVVLPPRSESGGRFLELSCRISPPPRVTTPWVEWGGDVQLSEAPSSSSLTVCRHSQSWHVCGRFGLCWLHRFRLVVGVVRHLEVDCAAYKQ